ncbi:uncharacterized protein LOC131005863 isoform X1 [Salvia miltiorrhiza]|uniref:uncharacterized protein LOC131005863 isoform X1 n=1 Tax=Salvia miltiorrhiza TaxID=226208 RepID=UPI0025AD105E|nr:uncharacterized protein LOC131005863 isoform X1 [Salvia miltiorrhiza]XP_057788948.1 uncharacterized protein LOC131005863 isoform X1 [Salvia miltiorrhiza]
MSTSFSPSRAPAISRMQLGAASMSRLRSSSIKKPPEPLRRAVADCLSAAAPSQVEASRTLRDYMAAQATIDLAYGMILEHTLAERERSPAVVGRCVALLKRFLLRYKPSEETLLQIDRFCISIIAECDMSPHRKLLPWSRSLSQQSLNPAPSTNVNPLPVSSFASGALVKSLNYVRSLVAQYIPKRSFQPAAFAGAAPASRQSLPTLSSLLSKSFNSQLSPANAKESLESKDTSIASVSDSPITEEVDEIGNLEFMALDVFRWRWSGDQHPSLLLPKSDQISNLQDIRTHNFLEVGAAALLVGDMEAKMKGEAWKIFGSAEMPFLDQLLQPSLLTTLTNSNSAFAHLRAITALKRSKQGTDQIWEDSPMSTFRPRARPLFQYRHYSEQQPLRLNPVEVCEVIAAVCSETSNVKSNQLTVSSKLRHSGRPSMDVAVSVLVKLVIDMYVLDSETAAPLALSLLEDMLNSPRVMSKTRAFDLIINLGVHAHLLEPPTLDGSTMIDEQYSQEAYFDNGTQDSTNGIKTDFFRKTGNSSAIEKFECWILGILFEVLLHLVQIEEEEEAVWASSLSCLLYFVCDRGKIRRSRLKGLDIRVIEVLMKISRKNTWAEIVHSKLICMMTNLFYQMPEEPDKNVLASPLFLVNQVDLIGGIDFIFGELVLSTSREERRNLYLVIFDYVLHKINEGFIAAGVSEYSDDEVRPIATLLVLADAPEALHSSVKLGVEGIVELLRRSISASLSTYPNNDRLLMLLEKIVEKFDALIGSYTRVDKEFTQMIKITKSLKSIESIGGVPGNAAMSAKLCWTTLHSLLHSERICYRQNGYLWLGDLLIAEINREGDLSLSSVKNLEQKISLAGVNDYSASLDIPLPIWLMCGLLKSKNNHIRWGFLFVLERLLIQCKFLLDEKEVQQVMRSQTTDRRHDKSRLQKANAVIDIMSCGLSLMAQENETDRMNILKMCDILLSQLCLKVANTAATKFGDTMHRQDSMNLERMKKSDRAERPSIAENIDHSDFVGSPSTKIGKNVQIPIRDTASMAALLLRGQAIVPMQLIARVPAALFYWPLIQLAGAATDNIALGVSVGSKGRGNLPGGTSDIRATLLLLLIGKCTADPAAFKDVGGEEFFRELLDDTDARVAYYSSTFLLKRMMTEEPESYQRKLQSLVSRAQQSNNEKLLENPYLQMRGLLQLSNE